MSRVSDLVRQIRTAVYGRDVRESIASGIEQCYSDVMAAKTHGDAAEQQAALARTATDNANTAAALANTKASEAQTAAALANTKASDAQTAASNANRVAEKYDQITQAITDANTAASNATTKAGLADTAASTATDAANLANSKANAANSAAAAANQAASEIDSIIAEQNQTIRGLREAVSGKIDGGYIENGSLYLTSDGVTVAGPFAGIGGGGGGGGGGTADNDAVLTINFTDSVTSYTVAKGTAFSVRITWSSVEGEEGYEEPTGNGSLAVSVNGTLKTRMNVAQGIVTVHLTEYLDAGENQVAFQITDVYGNSRKKVMYVDALDLRLISSFDENIYNYGDIEFRYTPYGGNTEKTVYFIVDGQPESEAVTATITRYGREETQILPALSHGSHSLKVYYKVLVNGALAKSEELNYEIICVESGEHLPIIATSFHSTEVDQWSTVNIPYRIYTPDSLTSDLDIYVGDTKVQSLSGIDRSPDHSFSYRMAMDIPSNEDSIQVPITFQSGNATKIIVLTVNKVAASIETETANLAIHFTSQGRSNNEGNPAVWTSTEDSSTAVSAAFEGFNWLTDGWVTDTDGITVMRIPAGGRVTIPYHIFGTDFRRTGKTIEVEFATRSVRNYSTPTISCMSGGIGLSITPQDCNLISKERRLFTQYREGEHIRVSFVCEKDTPNRLMLVYINAIPSGVTQYPAANENFQQTIPVGLTLGCDDCITDIYNIRVYDNALTPNQVLNNWIADTQNGELMLQRFNRNNVYESEQVRISKLPSDLPYMILTAEQLPQYKGDKKKISGSFTYPQDTSLSFTFSGCEIDVQGTSSATYARKNYDMKFKSGFVMNDGTQASTYALDPSVIPFNRFVLKADVASSEGANNVELVKLYCDLTPFNTRERVANPKVRPGIFGFPIVVFWQDAATGDISFLGKYNFNLPKRAAAPYGYSGDMESWEFQTNNMDLMKFLTDYFDPTMKLDESSGTMKETWKYAYEARFPDDTWDNISKLQEFQSFVYSTYRANATGNALPSSVTYEGVTYTNDTAAYRLAKFRAEFGNYAEVNSFIFYYIFTELFLMVDSRAKNLFIGFTGSDTDPTKVQYIDRKAVAEPYDMDTALGNNNEGEMMRKGVDVDRAPYALEDEDTPMGARVFNGQESVLWNNLRDAFVTEIRQMYSSLRGSGLNYAAVVKRFEDHQKVWPEAIWIEDSWFKYIDPLISPEEGKAADGQYLKMMQGSKEEQRKWWLYNRFQYMDSKWSAGDARSKVITVRAYRTGTISVTPYADLYVVAQCGSVTVRQRAEQGIPISVTFPIDDVNDAETYVYSAEQIAELGDLSQLNIGYANFSAAIRLQNVKIGDASSSYENTRLNNVTFGSNPLLKKVDLRNCTSMGTGDQKGVDLSGCPGIEEAYFGGTKITSVSLANGCPIRILDLPGTVTDLTLQNTTKLTTLTCPSFANLTTLRLENPPDVIDVLDILGYGKPVAQQMAKGSRLRIIGFRMTGLSGYSDIEDFYDYLDEYTGIDDNGYNTEKPQIQGTIHVSSIIGTQIVSLKERYPYIDITADTVQAQIVYKDWEGENTLYTETVTQNGNGTYNGQPSHASTEQYVFTFAGWSQYPRSTTADANAQKNINNYRVLYAAYTTTLQKYTVRYLNSNNAVLQTFSNVEYGSSVPAYTGSTPTHPSESTMTFNGWNRNDTVVHGNIDFVAVYFDNNLPIFKYLKRTITDYESDTATKIGQHAFDGMTSLQTVETTATTIEQYAFNGCSNLTSVDLKATSGQVSIEANAFSSCNKLTALIIRSSTVATLASSSALPSAPFTVGEGAIYVPDNLVATYKAASGWSTYASRIYGISQYPVTDFSSTTDS